MTDTDWTAALAAIASIVKMNVWDASLTELRDELETLDMTAVEITEAIDWLKRSDCSQNRWTIYWALRTRIDQQRTALKRLQASRPAEPKCYKPSPEWRAMIRAAKVQLREPLTTDEKAEESAVPF